MKKTVVLILLMLSLLSCSNDNDSNVQVTVPEGSIVLKIDGVETYFNVDAGATLQTIPWEGQTATKLSIRGKRNAEIDAENILIWFFVTPATEIDEGTYPDLDKQIYHFLELNADWNGDLYNYGSNRLIDNFYSSKSTIVRIDSLAQGVFSGNVAIGTGPAGVNQPPFYHKVTGGQFNVRITNQ